MTYSTQSADIDKTIAALEQDPNSVPPEEAIALIEGWQQELEGNDIGADLGELKQALQQNDTAKINLILSDLSEDTLEAAVDLPGDISTKVQQIGMLLSQMSGQKNDDLDEALN